MIQGLPFEENGSGLSDHMVCVDVVSAFEQRDGFVNSLDLAEAHTLCCSMSLCVGYFPGVPW